jgi:hypothetical protein
MDVWQATALICNGLAAARGKGEIVGDFDTVGDLLWANPEITREVCDWLCTVYANDLATPSMGAHLKACRWSEDLLACEDVLRGFNDKLPELSLACMYGYVWENFSDEVLNQYPYPFSFGRCAATLTSHSEK